MEFLYTIDPNATEPIMLIDKHIGFDPEEGEGIMGDKFSRELMFLDTLGKSKIHIWINSPGGVVTDGEQIFGTILKTKTKVDTHNVGIAASIAGPIFLAGRSRYMMDYAKLMIHPVSGGDTKARQALEDAVVTMLSSRSLVSPERIKEMMEKTTWLSAEDCKSMGLCDVESSSEYNRPRATNDYKDFKSIVNTLINNKKPKKMNKVTNKLGLVDGANEELILNAIAEIENKVSAEANKVSAAKKALDEAEAKYNELKAKYDTLEAENKAANEAKAKAEAEAKVANATELVSNAVKLGKITNDAKVIESWKEQAIANFEVTKNLIDSIAVNKSGAKITNEVKAENESALTSVIAKAMAEQRNKLNNN